MLCPKDDLNPEETGGQLLHLDKDAKVKSKGASGSASASASASASVPDSGRPISMFRSNPNHEILNAAARLESDLNAASTLTSIQSEKLRLPGGGHSLPPADQGDPDTVP